MHTQGFLSTIPFFAFCLSIFQWTPAWLDVLTATSAVLFAMNQQFHAWAHTGKSHLPAAVIALQVTFFHFPLASFNGLSHMQDFMHASGTFIFSALVRCAGRCHHASY